MVKGLATCGAFVYPASAESMSWSRKDPAVDLLSASES